MSYHSHIVTCFALSLSDFFGLFFRMPCNFLLKSRHMYWLLGTELIKLLVWSFMLIWLQVGLCLMFTITVGAQASIFSSFFVSFFFFNSCYLWVSLSRVYGSYLLFVVFILKPYWCGGKVLGRVRKLRKYTEKGKIVNNRLERKMMMMEQTKMSFNTTLLLFQKKTITMNSTEIKIHMLAGICPEIKMIN